MFVQDFLIELLIGAGTLLGGVAQLVIAINGIKKRKPKSKIKIAILIAVVLLVSSVATFSYLFWESTVPLNVRLTTKAWRFYNKGKYDMAITYAERCINEYKGGANREQHKLGQERASLPPVGKVSDKQEREKIWERGLLNDVATCFYIKGRSLEALGQRQEAIAAHGETSKYTYARCWDPKVKIFWSPAEASLDRLQILEK